MKALFRRKSGGLNDKEILKLLKELPEMYENGELIEVEMACVEIAGAINAFSNSEM